MLYTHIRSVGKHWIAAVAMCALLASSLISFAEASSSWNNYPYDYNYGSYQYPCNSYPYNQYNPYRYTNQYPSYTNYPPSCTISIQAASGYGDRYYTDGYPMLLTWSSQNASTASISPSVGSVSPSGSRVVYTRGEVYSMSVYGAGGTAVCQTSSYSIPSSYYNYGYTYPKSYYPSYTVPTTYTTPTLTNYVNTYVSTPSAQTVSLKQIPYTGTSFGIVGDMLIWFSVTLVALLGAVGIVYAKQGEIMKVVRTRRS